MFTSKIKLFAALAAFTCVMMISAQYATAGEWNSGETRSPMQLDDASRNPGSFPEDQVYPTGESSARAIPQQGAVQFDGSMPESIRNHMLPENFNRNDRDMSNPEWVERNSVVR